MRWHKTEVEAFGPFCLRCAVYAAALFINLACWRHPGDCGICVVVWLKPAFDRVVLHVLAAANVWGDSFFARHLARRYHRKVNGGTIVWRCRSLMAVLTLRSFHLPMIQLEGARPGRPASASSCSVARGAVERFGSRSFVTILSNADPPCLI
jgi:hypothetical protein